MLNKLQCSVKKFTHIVHVADIHIRLTKRHDEYTEIFTKFYDEVKKTPSTTLIAILGDLFHNKSDLSPECVQSAREFLFNCAELRPTILIAGNHDATLTNKNRLDSLTPIVGALNHSNLFYLKDNGLYAIGNILFNNMSVFTESEDYLSYEDIPPNYKNEYLHHIALYHGPVNSALTDLGFYMVNKTMPVEIFDGHHIVLLGDIHKKQDLQFYENLLSKPAIHYPGSMIQQNHGESIDGHGFSLWDLATKTYIHTNIPNDYGFFTVEVNKGKLVTDLTNIPKKARVHIKCFESVISEVKAVVADIKKSSLIDEISYGRVPSDEDQKKLQVANTINLADIADVTYQNQLLTEFLKDKCKITDQSIIDSVLSINTNINTKVDKDNLSRNIRWKPKKFEFSNMFSYGEGNVIDFSKTKDVMGLFGPNTCGKSSVFSALSFCIFDKFDRGYKAKDVLNVQKSNFSCKFNFEVNGVDYFIERKGLANRKGDVKVDVKFWKVEGGKDVELNGEARRNTNDVIKEIVGSYEDFILTSLSVQSGKNVSSFIDMGQSERKDLLSQFIGLTLFDKLLEVASDESKSVGASLKLYKKDDLESKKIAFENELSSLTLVFNDETEQLSKLSLDREITNENLMVQIGLLMPVESKYMSINVENVNKRIDDLNKRKSSDLHTILETKANISAADGTINSLKSKIKEIEDRDFETNRKKYDKVKSELDKLENHLNIKKVEVGSRVSRMDSLKKHEFDPNCKYCIGRNKSVADERKKLDDELSADKILIKNALEERNKLKSELDALVWVLEIQTEYTKLLKELNGVKDKVSIWERTVSLGQLEIQNHEKEIESLKKDLDEYNKQLKTIESNKNIQSEIDKLKLEIKNVDFNINQKNKRIQEVNNKMAVLTTQIRQLIESIEKVKKLEKEYESYSLYVKAVNRDGLPYMVIQRTVPEVEREVNNILSQMVDFHLVIETDGKNVVPYIVYDDKRWPIEMASGFEKFVSSLAIRVALVNVSNLPRPNFLTIDEGWGVMDADNLSQVKILLQFLKTNFDFIIIISHLDSIKDAVDNLLEITKVGDFSHIEYK